jgi:hypothetical protein
MGQVRVLARVFTGTLKMGVNRKPELDCPEQQAIVMAVVNAGLQVCRDREDVINLNWLWGILGCLNSRRESGGYGRAGAECHSHGEPGYSRIVGCGVSK